MLTSIYLSAYCAYYSRVLIYIYTHTHTHILYSCYYTLDLTNHSFFFSFRLIGVQVPFQNDKLFNHNCDKKKKKVIKTLLPRSNRETFSPPQCTYADRVALPANGTLFLYRGFCLDVDARS